MKCLGRWSGICSIWVYEWVGGVAEVFLFGFLFTVCDRKGMSLTIWGLFFRGKYKKGLFCYI